jgi:hypothetical protein
VETEPEKERAGQPARVYSTRGMNTCTDTSSEQRLSNSPNLSCSGILPRVPVPALAASAAMIRFATAICATRAASADATSAASAASSAADTADSSACSGAGPTGCEGDRRKSVCGGTASAESGWVGIGAGEDGAVADAAGAGGSRGREASTKATSAKARVLRGRRQTCLWATAVLLDIAAEVLSGMIVEV